MNVAIRTPSAGVVEFKLIKRNWFPAMTWFDRTPEDPSEFELIRGIRVISPIRGRAMVKQCDFASTATRSFLEDCDCCNIVSP